MSRDTRERSWELVQIKAFTSWLNDTVSKRSLSVQDIKSDLSDGVRLINFLEILSGKKVQIKYDENPPTRIQKIQNLHIALKFLEKEMDVKLHGTGAEDFADQNLKMILGFLWTLFKKYKIAVIKHEDKSSEEGLLSWCKQTTQGYRDVSIESYKTSFRDGMAFLALVDKYLESNKEIFDYDKFQRDTPVDNLTTAFEFAEKHLGIPKLLEAQEVTDGNVDERSLVLYISLYFHAFVAKQQKNLIEQEKKQIEARMRGLEGSLEQRAQRGAELEQENKNLQKDLQELKDKNLLLEERVTVLQQLLDTANQEKEAQTATIQQLQQDLSSVKQSLAKEETKANELSELKITLEDQVQNLKSEVVEIKSQLESETVARSKENQEYSQRSKAEIQGLGVLKQNLEQHLEDLFRWQKFLNMDSDASVDFSGEIRPQIISEISKTNFDEQLAQISKRLDKENGELLQLLKQKEAEVKAKKAQEEKKRERQKKNEN